MKEFEKRIVVTIDAFGQRFWYWASEYYHQLWYGRKASIVIFIEWIVLIILISKALSAIFISDDKDEILKDVQRRFEDISRHISMIS